MKTKIIAVFLATLIFLSVSPVQVYANGGGCPHPPPEPPPPEPPPPEPEPEPPQDGGLVDYQDGLHYWELWKHPHILLSIDLDGPHNIIDHGGEGYHVIVLVYSSAGYLEPPTFAKLYLRRPSSSHLSIYLFANATNYFGFGHHIEITAVTVNGDQILEYGSYGSW